MSQPVSAEDTFYYSKLSTLGIEEWLPIPGYEGYYEVSNLGRVKSMERFITCSDGKSLPISEKILVQPLSTTRGIPQVNLSLTNKTKTFTTHQLIALAFIGDRPKRKDVAHNNGNSFDNCLCNLRYATRQENIDDKRKHGTVARGSSVGISKLKELDVLSIRRLLSEEAISQRQIANLFGVSVGTINSIHLGNTWGWLK